MTQIIKDRPMPDAQSGRKTNHPWSTIEVGESFIHSKEATRQNQLLAAANATYYQKKHPGRKFATRMEADGIVVYRTH